MYATGQGVTPNGEEAIKWLKIVENGEIRENAADAQCVLGRMYQAGDVVPKDNIEAYKWFSLAAEGEGANPHANKSLNELIGAMTPDEIESGKKRIEEYKRTR